MATTGIAIRNGVGTATLDAAHGAGAHDRIDSAPTTWTAAT